MAKEVDINKHFNNQQRTDMQTFQIEQVPVPVSDSQTQTPVSASCPPGSSTSELHGSILNLANHIIHLNQTNGMIDESAVTENDEKIGTRIFHPLQLSLNLNCHNVMFVNPKQYSRILKRREQRQKLISAGKIPSTPGRRRKYIHESRHQHAVKRIRGFGGRFSSKS